MNAKSVAIDLSGKKALVTGSAGGIGRASAIAMAEAGADVAVVDLKREEGLETVESIRSIGQRSTFIECDVADPEAVAAMVRQVIEELGGLDIAHNNAGIMGRASNILGRNALPEWQRVMDVNLNSVFYCCSEEARHRVEQRSGRIVNTASISGSRVNNLEYEGAPELMVGNLAYCTAKAGVKHLTKGLAAGLVKYDVYVNSISPGYVVTPMTQVVQETPALLDHENLTTPIHRQGQREEMVGGILYLVSDAASFTTGHDLVMDGGYTIW